jgi:TolB protein
MPFVMDCTYAGRLRARLGRQHARRGGALAASLIYFCAGMFGAPCVAAAEPICDSQVYPPTAGDIGSESFQSPACLSRGRIAFTVWHGGYNGWDTDGRNQSRSADVYIVDPSEPGKPVTVLPPAGVDKVNNIGHVAAGDDIIYNCNWSELCISNIRTRESFRMLRRPTDKVGGRFQEPVFDPTATHIVFEWTKREDEQNDRGTADICTVDRDGSNWRCAGFPGYNKQPDWSPKGDRIVFQRQCAPDCWQLWLANVRPDGTIDTASAVQLTNEHRSNTDASWSPDGRKIVYSCGDGITAMVCVSEVDGGGKADMLSGLEAPYNGAVSWCNDGYIYFEAGVVSKPQQPTVICRIPAPRQRAALPRG